MVSEEQMLRANPEFADTLFADSGFVKHVYKHIHELEYQTILMQRTQLSDEQKKILSELKSNQMFIDWRYIENPTIKIQDIDNPAYQRYLIDEYTYYKKSWLGKIKSKLLEFNIQFQEMSSPDEFTSSFRGLQEDIQEILFSPKKLRTLISHYFTLCTTNSASSLIEMKRSLTLRNVASFIIAHMVLIAAMPAVIVTNLILLGLLLARAAVSSIIINTYLSTMALTYFFGTKSNSTTNKSNIENRNSLRKFFTFVGHSLINVLKFAISIVVPLLLATSNMIGIVAIAIPLSIVQSLLSPILIFTSYIQTYKFQSEKEAREAKEAKEAKDTYKEKLKAYANEHKRELSSLHKLISSKAEDTRKFMGICDTTQTTLKSALKNSSFREAYTAIHNFQGLLNQFGNSLEIQKNTSIVIIKEFISDHGPLALNCNPNVAPPLNDEQKNSIAVLITVFDSILQDKKLFSESKPSTGLAQPSMIVNSFDIHRKPQPEHVAMVSINENQLDAKSKYTMISSKLYSQRNKKMLTI